MSAVALASTVLWFKFIYVHFIWHHAGKYWPPDAGLSFNCLIAVVRWDKTACEREINYLLIRIPIHPPGLLVVVVVVLVLLLRRAMEIESLQQEWCAKWALIYSIIAQYPTVFPTNASYLCCGNTAAWRRRDAPQSGLLKINKAKWILCGEEV